MSDPATAAPAHQLHEHRGDPDEWEEEAVDIQVRPRRSEVVSFRLPSPALDELERAAAEAGESLSQYIRRALELRLKGPAVAPSLDIMTGRGNLVMGLQAYAGTTSRSGAPGSVVPDYPPMTNVAGQGAIDSAGLTSEQVEQE